MVSLSMYIKSIALYFSIQPILFLCMCDYVQYLMPLKMIVTSRVIYIICMGWHIMCHWVKCMLNVKEK